ncbi:lysylphosphatidylglycerol synthase transmembrane domain-containing protein [Phenylobacterium sp. LjRoot225]|uniref:lysylphosphatidylglycerol synthase transmembrane domain-containing protein n=1 Tax=Phenylobacterium sp. LjRoot225 TaxID=3342285 RepID=UPI003ECE498A
MLGYVLYKADLFTADGWNKFATTFSRASYAFVAASIAMNIVLDFISAAKWQVLSRALGLKSGVWSLFCYYLSGRFFNLVLPSNIGGDVIRVNLQGRSTGDMAAAAASVFTDRLTGFVVLLILATGGSLLHARSLQAPFVKEALAVSALGLLALLWVIFDRRPFDLLRRVCLSLVPRLDGLFHKSDKVLNAINLYRRQHGRLAGAFLLSLLFYAGCGVSYWLNVAAFAPSAPLVRIMDATPFIMLIMNIPLSLGNVGLMEFAYTVVLGLFGVPPSVALSAAVLHRLKTFFAAGAGGVIYNLTKLEIPMAVTNPKLQPCQDQQA